MRRNHVQSYVRFCEHTTYKVTEKSPANVLFASLRSRENLGKQEKSSFEKKGKENLTHIDFKAEREKFKALY
jgi:hypothetical protein